jgi:hypothetical protein
LFKGFFRRFKDGPAAQVMTEVVEKTMVVVNLSSTVAVEKRVVVVHSVESTLVRLEAVDVSVVNTCWVVVANVSTVD